MPGDLLQVAYVIVAVTGRLTARVVEGFDTAVGVVVQAQFTTLGIAYQKEFILGIVVQAECLACGQDDPLQLALGVKLQLTPVAPVPSDLDFVDL